MIETLAIYFKEYAPFAYTDSLITRVIKTLQRNKILTFNVKLEHCVVNF